MQACTGLDDEGFAKVVEETELDSHHGGRVVLMECLLERAREIRGALDVMWTAPGTLAEEVDARTDDHGVFHWRMGKQAAFQGRMETTRGDDAVQCRLKPEVHPVRRDAAVAAVLGALASR